MSSPVSSVDYEVEEEVEFVSERAVRPVLDCIDLRNDSDDEGSSSNTMEDEDTCHNASATSTLDRLAQQVALKKEENAKRCREFKEKQMRQRVHGQQELALSPANAAHQEAKRCVEMWLKMPGVKPGVIRTGSRRHGPSSFPRNTSTTHTCPVINCGRVFDHLSLLDGHLKRFDHSPCDPTISLKGCPSELFACAACGKHFQTKDEWKKHLDSKASSSTPDGHSMTQTYQCIVCFACPACYLFFNLRDECLQHMSAQNHFSESLTMPERRARALPVPIPQYVKNHLITLCKDVRFNVRCSICHRVLISHQAAQAHFNVHCRQGCALVKADRTVVQVMKQIQVLGQCALCCELFFSPTDIERHKESTQHDVEVNQTMDKAVLQCCRFRETQHTRDATEVKRGKHSPGLEALFKKRNYKTRDGLEFPSKRQRLSPSVKGSAGRKLTAWYCECGLQFSEEAVASKHLLAVNQIFHQCGVCGKHMGESSITRLHMSRFHGGAHLSNFLFFCRKCKVEMPRYEDIMSHVSQHHSKHTYFAEQEVPEDINAATEAKPSTSNLPSTSTKSTVQQHTEDTFSVKAEQTWMCRMCEDVFDSEEDVQKHCGDVNSHSYQRFMCGHCPQKFFKESTLRRHCTNEHKGQIKIYHFCGLCDSMQFEFEGEFLEHYESLHSTDYYCIDEGKAFQPTVAESTSQPSCPCMGSDKSRQERKATYTQCMRDLAAEGKCQYVCAPCDFSVPSYAQMKTHVHTKHPALNLDKTFDVQCKTCQERLTGVPSFHKHYHAHHCALEPCLSSRAQSEDRNAEPTSVNIVKAVEINPDTNEIDDDALVKFLNMEQTTKENEEHDDKSDDGGSEDAIESAELEEALKRSLLEF